MSEIVRGRCFPWDLKDFNRRHFVAVVDDTRKEKEDIEVLILPIEDGKCGPFEKEMTTHLMAAAGQLDKEGYLTSPQIVRRIATAISRLFEEVESED